MVAATFLRLPVSATHTIIGAIAGFGYVLFGAGGIKWKSIIKIGENNRSTHERSMLPRK